MVIRFSLNHLNAFAKSETRYWALYDVARSYAGIEVGQEWSHNDFTQWILDDLIFYYVEVGGSRSSAKVIEQEIYNDIFRKGEADSEKGQWLPLSFEWCPLFTPDAPLAVLANRYTKLYELGRLAYDRNLVANPEPMFCVRGIEYSLRTVLTSIGTHVLEQNVALKLRDVKAGTPGSLKALKRAVKHFKTDLDEFEW